MKGLFSPLSIHTRVVLHARQQQKPLSYATAMEAKHIHTWEDQPRNLIAAEV